MDIEFGIAASDQGVSSSLWDQSERWRKLTLLCTVTHLPPTGSCQWWISQLSVQRLPRKSPSFDTGTNVHKFLAHTN